MGMKQVGAGSWSPGVSRVSLDCGVTETRTDQLTEFSLESRNSLRGTQFNGMTHGVGLHPRCPRAAHTACDGRLCPSLLNSMFSDITLVLEIDHGGSICTMDISTQLQSIFPLESQWLNIYLHALVWSVEIRCPHLWGN